MTRPLSSAPCRHVGDALCAEPDRAFASGPRLCRALCLAPRARRGRRWRRALSPAPRGYRRGPLPRGVRRRDRARPRLARARLGRRGQAPVAPSRGLSRGTRPARGGWAPLSVLLHARRYRARARCAARAGGADLSRHLPRSLRGRARAKDRGGTVVRAAARRGAGAGADRAARMAGRAGRDCSRPIRWRSATWCSAARTRRRAITSR